MGRTSDAKERLLRAAMELIWTQTYGAVGVEAICRAAGVKKGSFYHFFESKENLAAQALETHWQHYLPAMRRAFSSEIAPLDRLFGYFDEIYRYNLQRKMGGKCICGCPYLHIGAEMIQGNRKILETAHRILAGYLSFFRKALLDAQEAKFIGRDKDPEALTRYVFAFFEGTLALSRIHNDPEILRDLVPGTRQILGLAARSELLEEVSR